MTVGVLGGGQLGLMLAEAVQHLGHDALVLDPDDASPCALRLGQVQRGRTDDAAALRDFFGRVDVATYDSENLASQPLAPYAAQLRPSLRVLQVSQDRLLEKAFLAERGFGPVAWAPVPPGASLHDAVWAFGLPCIVKTARLGYDGKGQWRVSSEAQLAALPARGEHGFVVEEVLALSAEVSCIVARGQGRAEAFPVFENLHAHHILDLTVLPARVDVRWQQQARATALHIAEALDVTGLLTVEFFVGTGRDGTPRLFVNELAPRVHNSGHVTRKACARSQFDVLAELLVGLPPSAPALRPGGFCMAQLLGDVWLAQGRSGGTLALDALGRVPGVEEVYLYGKREARAGRKMGHLITHGPDADTAVQRALAARAALEGARS